MSGRIFQNAVLQIKEAADRVIGVIDAEGSVISCSDLGLIGMIGKGQRSAQVIDAIRRNGGVYFAATGGAGALIAGSVKSARIIAFDDLGTEAIRELEVENLPLIVAIDAHGGNLYEEGPLRYRQEDNR